MWSSVDNSCCISAFRALSSVSSPSSRWRSSSARLSSVFSWALISVFTSEHLLFMESISSVNILSLSSSAACAKHWQDRDNVVKAPCAPRAPSFILEVLLRTCIWKFNVGLLHLKKLIFFSVWFIAASIQFNNQCNHMPHLMGLKGTEVTPPFVPPCWQALRSTVEEWKKHAQCQNNLIWQHL